MRRNSRTLGFVVQDADHDAIWTLSSLGTHSTFANESIGQFFFEMSLMALTLTLFFFFEHGVLALDTLHFSTFTVLSKKKRCLSTCGEREVPGKKRPGEKHAEPRHHVYPRLLRDVKPPCTPFLRWHPWLCVEERRGGMPSPSTLRPLSTCPARIRQADKVSPCHNVKR